MSEERTSIVRMNVRITLLENFSFGCLLKELWNHLDGSSTVTIDPIELGSWESKDAKVVSWLSSSIESCIVNNLRSFNIANEIWDSFQLMYH